MEIKKSYKPELVAAKDDGRLPLNHLLLERESALEGGGPALIATNGRMLVIVPVEAESADVDGLIPVEALKAARKIGPKSRNAVLSANGRVEYQTKDGGSTSVERPEGKWPPYRSVIPKPDHAWVTLCVNAEYLLAVQKAMGASGLTICFDPAGNRPMLARPLNDGEQGEGLASVEPLKGGRDGKERAVVMPLSTPR